MRQRCSGIVLTALALVLPGWASAQVITSPAANSVTTVRPWKEYATHDLRDPWDMRERTDIGFFTWGIDQPESHMVGKKIAADQYGNSVFRGTPATDDPSFFLLDPLFTSGAQLGKVGANYPIRTSEYTHLYVKMRIANEMKAINFGTLGLTAPPQMQVYWSRNSIFSNYTDPQNGRPNGGLFTTVNGASVQVGIPFSPIFGGCSGFVAPCGSVEGGRYVIHAIPLQDMAALASLGTGITRWMNVNDPSGDSNINWGATGTLNADSLRLDPIQVPGATSGLIEVDWVRLVAPTGAPRTLTWTGGGEYDIVMSTEADCGVAGGTNPGNFAVIGYNQSTGFTFYPEAWPNGTYYVGLRDRFTANSAFDTPETREIRACSTGRYVVRDYPGFTFTSPNPEGSADDFATVQLGNPWDFRTPNDIDININITSSELTTVPAERPSGLTMGNLNVFKGISAPGTAQTVFLGDPITYLLRSDKRGLHKRIDATRYRLFTTDIGINRERDIAFGSHLRIIWHIAGETWDTLAAPGSPSVVADAEQVSNDLVVRHMKVDATRNEDALSTRYVMDRIQADMADRFKFPLETDIGPDTSPSRTGWRNVAIQCASAGCQPARIQPFDRIGIDNFRVDYHEFSDPTEFYVTSVRLAAHERTSGSFAISWTSDMPAVNPAGESAASWKVALFAVRTQPESSPGAGDASPMTPITTNCLANPGTDTFALTTSLTHPTLASGTFSWNTPTAGMTPGALYFVCAGLIIPGESAPALFNFSTWPVVYDPSASAALAPRLYLDRTELRLAAQHSGAITPPNLSSKTPAQTVNVTQVGGASAVGWTVDVCQNYDPGNPPTCSGTLDYLQIAPATGSGTGSFTVQLRDSSVLPVSTGGSVLGVVLRVRETSAGAASNSPQYVQLYITIVPPSTPTGRPVGQVDTPAQNATGVQGAIGVTGWVVDDIGLQHVKVYRNCLPFDNPASCQPVLGNLVVEVGTAALVPGARPDVEAAFPTYPQANQAGWGYLMLTNMLPHVPNSAAFGGQGPLTLFVVATDMEGQRTLLGRSPVDYTPTSFVMANDTIAKPFGAIDTPAQGGATSAALVNFGWAVTPDANMVADGTDILIPTNGSTMIVYIDGVPVGNVTYNQCRGSVGVGNPPGPGVFCDDDVANIFGNATPQPPLQPRLSNQSKLRNLDAARGPQGSFVFDTTTLTNGLHSIAWGVTDSAGRVEGIGSRNFVVVNGVSDPFDVDPDAGVRINPVGSDLGALASSLTALERLAPVVPARLGWDPAGALSPAFVDRGVARVTARAFERVEVALPRTLSGQQWEGYTVQHGRLTHLPAGSFLDDATARFTWQSVPGYLGDYDLLFVRKLADGRREVLPMVVRFVPRTTSEPQ